MKFEGVLKFLKSNQGLSSAPQVKIWGMEKKNAKPYVCSYLIMETSPKAMKS